MWYLLSNYSFFETMLLKCYLNVICQRKNYHIKSGCFTVAQEKNVLSLRAKVFITLPLSKTSMIME